MSTLSAQSEAVINSFAHQPRFARLMVFVATLWLSACAHPQPVKENPAMTSDPTPSSTAAQTTTSTPASKPTAEQLLTRLLDLIRTTSSIDEFTQDRLEKNFGVNFTTYKPWEYGVGERLTDEWWYRIDMDHKSIIGPQFTVQFLENSSGPSPGYAMTGLCQVDFERFGSELQKMEFTREPYYAEHGRHLYDRFHKSNLDIRVSPRGEANEPFEKRNHLCVEMVMITPAAEATR